MTYQVNIAVQGSPKPFAYYHATTLKAAKAKREQLTQRHKGATITIDKGSN
jgi:hypothetical protein